MQPRGKPHRRSLPKPPETDMTKTPPITPTFESRLVPQSRECADLKGNIFFEHNSWLEPGETVVAAGGEAEMTVAKSPYRNPITLKEFVTVARKRKDGSEEWIELPVSAVRRLKLA
jgi:hypothetical protein